MLQTQHVETQNSETEKNKSGTQVIIYQSELDYLSRCILDYPNIETGGQLFGFYNSKGIPVVCYAIGPGPHATHQPTLFNQDFDYLDTIGLAINHEFGLQHIGEWHSHHMLGPDYPGNDDVQTMRYTIDEMHLGKFLLCIGTLNGSAATVNAFTIYENNSVIYQNKWHIKALPSPYRAVIDSRMKDLLQHPRTQEPRLKNMLICYIATAKETDDEYLLRALDSDNQIFDPITSLT